jgi:hypothetical protein
MIAAASAISIAATSLTAMRTGITNGAVVGNNDATRMYQASGTSLATGGYEGEPQHGPGQRCHYGLEVFGARETSAPTARLVAVAITASFPRCPPQSPPASHCQPWYGPIVRPYLTVYS